MGLSNKLGLAYEHVRMTEGPLTPTLSPRAGRGSRAELPSPCESGEREGFAQREGEGQASATDDRDLDKL
jgi:hypothetical protein